MPARVSPLQGKTVAFDFDACVHSYVSGWTGVVPTDGPEPGSLETIQWLIEQGAEVVIFTTRASHEGGTEAVCEWLIEHDYPIDDLTVTDIKVPAVAYIDDRAVAHAPGINDWVFVRDRVVALALRKHGSARQ